MKRGNNMHAMKHLRLFGEKAMRTAPRMMFSYGLALAMGLKTRFIPFITPQEK
jgi:hypothetical protein